MTRLWWNIRVCAVLQQPAYTILMAQSQPERLSAHMDVVFLFDNSLLLQRRGIVTVTIYVSTLAEPGLAEFGALICPGLKHEANHTGRHRSAFLQE